jgi:alkylhydroperoxidase/carboxymuconolactone decarboxylase family protein YurZ
LILCGKLTVAKTREAHPTELYHLRVPKPLRERVDLLAAEADTTAAMQMIRLIERGIDMHEMVRGPHSDLLTALFCTITVPPENLQTRLKEMIDIYFEEAQS